MDKNSSYGTSGTVIIFLITMSMILITYFWYKDHLFEPSHELIKKLQSGIEPDSVIPRFFDVLSDMTKGYNHVIYIFLINTFMSRERFWYYFLVAIFSHFMQAYAKIALHEPRPTAVWTDIWPLGCDFHYGSPSGHSLENCNILIVLFLDHFMPSEWSRQEYPELNLRSFKKNTLQFILGTVLVIVG